MNTRNVDLQSFFSKPINTAMETYTPDLFNQASQAYSTSALLRNSARARLKEMNKEPEKPVELSDPNKSFETQMAENGQQSMLDRMGRMGQTAVNRVSEGVQNAGEALGRAYQGTILGAKGTLTQAFGNKSGVEKYSGGVNYGTDFAVPRGTRVAAPEGDWVVVESFDKAQAEGPGNAQGGINRGYGNSVLIQNTKTGEKLRYSHLRVGGVGVQQGQQISGGTVLGETGASGNTAGRTGQHLDLEYYNGNGRIANVMTSPYGRYLQ
jgi:murein DD-endopeptidase MepM/ murein hydrolase activator NlpD